MVKCFFLQGARYHAFGIFCAFHGKNNFIPSLFLFSLLMADKYGRVLLGIMPAETEVEEDPRGHCLREMLAYVVNDTELVLSQGGQNRIGPGLVDFCRATKPKNSDLRRLEKLWKSYLQGGPTHPWVIACYRVSRRRFASALLLHALIPWICSNDYFNMNLYASFPLRVLFGQPHHEYIEELVLGQIEEGAHCAWEAKTTGEF